MRIEVIHAGNFMLDGGAMFGVVPKSIWNNLNPANENNMCNWAMRCLLVEDGNRLILIDTGMGDKQSAKFFSYYYLNGTHSLIKSLNNVGVDAADITDVVYTHLHFDHCGGGLQWNNAKTFVEPVFKNAQYWSHKEHWAHAMQPNVREKASFLKENFEVLESSGRLQFVEDDLKISPNISVYLANGHTEKMMCPIINTGDKKIAYMADLIPSTGHIKPNYVMGYDIRPLATMQERQEFLEKALAENMILFFEHDLKIESASLKQTDKGIRIDNQGDLNSF